jgi:hypothetical protein
MLAYGYSEIPANTIDVKFGHVRRRAKASHAPSFVVARRKMVRSSCESNRATNCRTNLHHFSGGTTGCETLQAMAEGGQTVSSLLCQASMPIPWHVFCCWDQLRPRRSTHQNSRISGGLLFFHTEQGPGFDLPNSYFLPRCARHRLPKWTSSLH